MNNPRSVQFVHELLELLVQQKGSDLFITVGFPPAVKVNGKISPVSKSPLEPQHTAELVQCIMNERQKAFFEETKECNYAIGLQGVGRFRVSAFMQQGWAGMVLRAINMKIPTYEDLAMPPVLKDVILAKRGIIVFVGATGAGKSTTMASLLEHRSQNSFGHIITIEDPIEYDVPGVGQVHVNEKAGVTFASALRSILRQDPDIIMIGEMRDFETAHIGVQSSLTGHLVLSTLHTNDSVSAVSRLVDMGIEPYLIAGSLLGVVAQRLVRRICPNCKQSLDAPATMKKYGIETVYHGVGCEVCRETGYKGRFGLYEQFDITPEIAEAISNGVPIADLRALAKKNGMRTLLELGLASVAAGSTTSEEMMRVVGEV